MAGRFDLEAFQRAVRDLCRPTFKNFPKDAKIAYQRGSVLAEENLQRRGLGTPGFTLNEFGFVEGPTYELWADLKKYAPRGDQYARNKPQITDFLEMKGEKYVFPK